MKSADLARIDELENNILNLSTRINAATYELLVMIREFDERVGWLQWSFQSCAEWLAWRCDMSMTTAREKVRVAHALKMLPRISEAFSTGELSYAKVRALTRVADRDNEEKLVEFALRTTAAVVAQRCRLAGPVADSRVSLNLASTSVSRLKSSARRFRPSMARFSPRTLDGLSATGPTDTLPLWLTPR